MSKVRDDISGSVRLFRYTDGTSRDTINSRMLCILAVPSSVGDDCFWPFVETSRPALSTRHEESSGIESIRLIRDPSWAQGRSMVVLQFATQDATENFFMGHNNRRFTLSAPEECQIVYLASVIFVPQNSSPNSPKDYTPLSKLLTDQRSTTAPSTSPQLQAPPPQLPSSLSSSSTTRNEDGDEENTFVELPTCPVCMDRLDPDVSGLLYTPCNKSFYMDTRTEWVENVCPVCACIASHGRGGVHTECQECGTTRDIWVCLVCGHAGCGRGTGSHALEHFATTRHTFCYDLEKKRIWDYTLDKYVHRIPFQYDDDDDDVSGGSGSTGYNGGVGNNPARGRGSMPASVDGPEGSKAVDAEVFFSRMFERQKRLLENEMRKTKQGLDKEREKEEARVRELERLVREAEGALEAERAEGVRLESSLEAGAKRMEAAEKTIERLRERVASMERAGEELRGVEGSLAREREGEEQRYARRERELREESARMARERDELRVSVRDLNSHFSMKKSVMGNPTSRNGDIITLAPKRKEGKGKKRRK